MLYNFRLRHKLLSKLSSPERLSSDFPEVVLEGFPFPNLSSGVDQFIGIISREVKFVLPHENSAAIWKQSEIRRLSSVMGRYSPDMPDWVALWVSKLPFFGLDAEGVQILGLYSDLDVIYSELFPDFAESGSDTFN